MPPRFSTHATPVPRPSDGLPTYRGPAAPSFQGICPRVSLNVQVI